MKNWIRGAIAGLLPALCLTLMLSGTARASNMESGCADMPKLTPKQIVERMESTYGEAPTDPDELYEIVPSFQKPYDAGKVREVVLQKAADRLNALRALAGLPAAALDSKLCENAQYAAVLLGCENVAFVHYPSKPSDMDDDFYSKAEYAARKSCLYAGRDLYVTPDGFMYNSDDRNVDRLGDRRWQLNPEMGKVGFGYVSGAPNRYGRYTAEMSHDRSVTNPDYNYIAWPPSGYFPNALFGGNTAWSVTINPKRFELPDTSNFRITLTREASETRIKREWVFPETGAKYTPASAGAYYALETQPYGVANCLIFRPDGVESYEGEWTVTISGLKDAEGENVPLSYHVTFFDADNPPDVNQPSYDSDQPMRMGTVGESLEISGADENGTRTVGMTVVSADGGEFVVAAAAYDSNGRLLGINFQTVELPAGEEQSVSLTLSGSTEAQTVRAFLLDSNRRTPASASVSQAVTGTESAPSG